MTYLADSGHPFNDALARTGRKFRGAFLAWTGYRAGQNFYELSNDVEDSFYRGAIAIRKWLWWYWMTKAWVVWLLITLWISYLDGGTQDGEGFQDFTGGLHSTVVTFWIALPIVFVLAVAVPYVRNVDYCLFKRHWFYWIFRPVAALLDRVPTPVLYLSILAGILVIEVVPQSPAVQPDAYTCVLSDGTIASGEGCVTP